MLGTILFMNLMRIIFLLIATLVIAFILKKVTEWVILTEGGVKFELSYWRAYKISVILLVINILVSLPFQLIKNLGCFSFLLTTIIQILIGATIYSVMIKYPNSRKSIGFGNGLLIQLCMVVIGVAIGLVVGTCFVLGSVIWG